jgi:Raf kinase inhibitor-like YbhB/YbcL family protein
MGKKIWLFLAPVVFIALGASLARAAEGEATMRLKSPEFEHNGTIPKKFTCEGNDISPALAIEGIPGKTQSLALIVDDPDAPVGIWIHWVVFDIPPVAEIKENTIPGKQGRNDFGRNNYGGPCPPSGTHRYFFKLYALDSELNLKEGVSKQDVEQAMEGHVLAKAELIGLYKKGVFR